MSFDLQQIDIHTPQRYAGQGFPWREWDQLRRLMLTGSSSSIRTRQGLLPVGLPLS